METSINLIGSLKEESSTKSVNDLAVHNGWLDGQFEQRGIIPRSFDYRSHYNPFHLSRMSALIEDIFDVKDVDKDGKKFDKVSRLICESESFKMGLILDIHSLIYKLVKGDKFRMVLTKNVLNDMVTDADDDDEDDAAEETDERLANSKMAEFDYVCYGKIYRIEAHDSGVDASRLSCYVSFGGLLMQLTGDASNLQGFRVGKHLYLMIKKLAF